MNSWRSAGCQHPRLLCGEGRLKGIVLAAGRGERLRPFTEEVPKPLLPVLNIPVLEFALASLENAGVDEVGINIFHAAERIAPYLQARPGTTPLVVSQEHQLMGSAGGLKVLTQRLGSGPYLIHSVDVVSDIAWDAVLEVHRRQRAPVTLVLTETPYPGEEGVAVDLRGRITDIYGLARGERGPYGLLGLHVVERDFAIRLPPQGDIVRDVYIPYLMRGGMIGSYMHTGYGMELRTPAQYLLAHRDLLDQRIKLPARITSRIAEERARQPRVNHGRIMDPSACAASSRLEKGASVGPYVVLGEGASVGADAHLEHAVLLPGASIPAHESLRHVIVGSGIIVRAEAP
ncbi:MAG: NDP-sugar synthase [Planctomycetota bacterium]